MILVRSFILILVFSWSFTEAVLAAKTPFAPLMSLQNGFESQTGLWGSVEVDQVSQGTALQVFQELKSRREFAWDFPADRCYAKAYLTSSLLHQAHLKNFTAWVLAPKGAPLLRVETNNAPKGCTSWVYHVAAGLAVQDGAGNVEGWILDPALSDHPLPLWSWVGKMTAHYKNGLAPIVWTSHPFVYRKEDLGHSQSNRLLARAEFDPHVLERYREHLAVDRQTVDSPSYQADLARLRELIQQGKNPAHQWPDPCGGIHDSSFDFDFSGVEDRHADQR